MVAQSRSLVVEARSRSFVVGARSPTLVKIRMRSTCNRSSGLKSDSHRSPNETQKAVDRRRNLDSVRILLEKIRKRSGERLTLVGGRPIVESREHLEQPDGRPKKLIAGEAQEMRQEFVRRGNPVDSHGRSCGSLSVDRTWEHCGSSTAGEVRKDVA